MGKILGLDLGTNSVGWALLEKENGQFKLLDKGVRIFQEGVKIEKGIEGSKAAERTGFRSARKLKYRRKLRKINTLKVLTEHRLCPDLTFEQLDSWRYKKIYPESDEFRKWWLTNESENKNPYYFRYLAANEKLNLENEKDRFILGRAFYHIAQRRGFLSNRLETTKESDGVVKAQIEEISNSKGDKTLGHYFYEKYRNGEKIRNHYTHRESHYLEEFNRICEKQKLTDNLKNSLYDAIFYQRPLKSQKGLIGKCVFEPKKQRASVSHPLFEEYRMFCFINNIKIKTPSDEKLRFLTNEEREKIISRFYLKRTTFPFEDLVKHLAPKKQYVHYSDNKEHTHLYQFNYKMNTTVTGNPLSAELKDLFGDDFMNFKKEYIRSHDGKASTIAIDDVWHVLMSFNKEEKLREFAWKHLGFDDKQMEKFCKINIKKDFAALSLKAIKKIIPFLREGSIYSHAVIMANLPHILPVDVWGDKKNQEYIKHKVKEIIETQNLEKSIIEIVNGMIKNCRDNGECWSIEAEQYFKDDLVRNLEKYFGEVAYNAIESQKRSSIEASAFKLFKKQMNINIRGEFARVKTINERIRDWLTKEYNLGEDRLGKIYHPSAIEVYKDAVRSDDGRKYLGSPLVSSMKNPMAMRALHQLRRVVNELIKNDIIDENTQINIEMSRGLLNANERKALRDWQNSREKKRSQFAEKIMEHYETQGIKLQPSNDDIMKYQFWEEQGHKCIYTGNEIALSDFLGANPNYDIEHTIPRSLSFDNSQENKTLCENKFNRSVKKNKIPTQLSNQKEIQGRVEMMWKKKLEELDKQIQKAVAAARSAIEKESKDLAIQRRHRLSFERDYLRNKMHRFFMKDIPQGFKNSQIVDTGIITKYSRLFLKSVFSRVNTVKGNTVADFRKMWGVQQHYEKKERINHVHHCIDAIVIACMTKENYEQLAKFYHDRENSFIKGVETKPKAEKPWPNFVEDLKKAEDEILVSHYTTDVLPKQGKKKLRKKGVPVKDKYGNYIYQQGDSVRGSLHKDTFYGAIEKEVKNKKGEKEKQIKYVVRKFISDLEDAQLKNIVDDHIREIVQNGRIQEKELSKKIDRLEKTLKNAEDDEEAAIKQQIQQIKDEIIALYSLPTKKGGSIPIKKVRIFANSVTNPIFLKKHRDQSTKGLKPYKQYVNVANDSNYLMAIYEGVDERGKIKRDFELKSNIEAAEFFKFSVAEMVNPQGIKGVEGFLPKSKLIGKNKLPLKSVIKIGTMVLFYEKNPTEVWELTNESLTKRLYKVVGLSTQRIKIPSGKIHLYATIVLRHSQEAKPASDLKTMDGEFFVGEEFKSQRKVNHNQFNCLVEGFDFQITPLGKILTLK